MPAGGALAPHHAVAHEQHRAPFLAPDTSAETPHPPPPASFDWLRTGSRPPTGSPAPGAVLSVSKDARHGERQPHAPEASRWNSVSPVRSIQEALDPSTGSGRRLGEGHDASTRLSTGLVELALDASTGHRSRPGAHLHRPQVLCAHARASRRSRVADVLAAGQLGVALRAGAPAKRPAGWRPGRGSFGSAQDRSRRGRWSGRRRHRLGDREDGTSRQFSVHSYQCPNATARLTED